MLKKAESNHELEAEKQEVEGKILQTLDENKQELAAACTRLERFSVNFDVRKMASRTKHDYHTFYILCGWMSETDAKKFQKEIESDADTFCIILSASWKITTTTL